MNTAPLAALPASSAASASALVEGDTVRIISWLSRAAALAVTTSESAFRVMTPLDILSRMLSL